MDLSPGARLGVYEILGQIGAGGMGEVYRARDSRLGRDVAIKLLPESFALDPDRLARFRREAKVLASLNHPAIAAIYGFEESDGRHALVLELVNGDTLAARIAGPRAAGRGLPVSDVVAIASQIADALDAAHEKGIVHRDLKPANVSVTPQGTVKILDFGLARTVQSDVDPLEASLAPTATTMGTRAGIILGTAAYMSPEQARGLPVDKRTDIWAFGCVVYEMLSGRPMFRGATLTDILAAIVDREPDWAALPPATPPHVIRLLQRCVEKDVKQRLRDIADARVELDPANRDAHLRVDAAASSRPWRSMAIIVAAMAAAAVATLGVQRGLAGRGASAPGTIAAPTVLIPATADDGIAADPALSNDGALLAYASDRGGMDNLDIWVQQAAGSMPLQLTRAPVDEHEPTFSPDGRMLAYRSEGDGGGIHVMPALGGQQPRLLVAAGRRPRFSPDGRLIAYWTGNRIGFSSTAGRYRTFVIPVSGGGAREIDGFTGARYPVWAPDGRSLLLLGSRDALPLPATYAWWRVPLDGAAPIRIDAGALLQRAGILFEEGDIGPEDWRDDRVLFSEGSYLWSIRLDARTSTASAVERLTFGTNHDFQGTTAASGIIALASASVSNSIWALPIDAARGVVTGAPRRLTVGTGMDSRPSPSSNGHLVAYRSESPRPSVVIRNLITQSVTDIGVPGTGFGPAISPDAEYVAYEDRGGVQLSGTRGGAPRTLCQSCRIGDWSADSRSLFVVKAESNSGRLVEIAVSDGATRDVIVSPDRAVSRPFPSPGKRLLVFRRGDVSGQGDTIMIAPLTTAQPVHSSAWIELVASEADARPSGWSPDGSVVYFLSSRDGTRCLYAQRVNPATGVAIGSAFAVHHFHGGATNLFVGGRGNLLSTGAANAIAGNFFYYDLSTFSSNVWTLSPR
jgi:Tol biopolymer transport system component